MAYSDDMNNFLYKQFGIPTESVKGQHKETINNNYSVFLLEL